MVSLLRTPLFLSIYTPPHIRPDCALEGITVSQKVSDNLNDYGKNYKTFQVVVVDTVTDLIVFFRFDFNLFTCQILSSSIGL